MNIDGETDIKTKSSLLSTTHSSLQSFVDQNPVVYCEKENPNTSSFEGVLKLVNQSQVEFLSIHSYLLRSCRIVFTGI